MAGRKNNKSGAKCGARADRRSGPQTKVNGMSQKKLWPDTLNISCFCLNVTLFAEKDKQPEREIIKIILRVPFFHLLIQRTTTNRFLNMKSNVVLSWLFGLLLTLVIVAESVASPGNKKGLLSK